MPKNNLHTLTCNIEGDLVRDDSMEGEEYWVAPMVLMLECVANGSEGPLLYPAAEIEKWTPSWNYKPLVAPDHPTDGSACTPEFLTDHKIGVVMNSSYDNKNRAEGWFHKKRTTALAAKVANALKQRRMMELSTGLYVDPEMTAGEHKGEKYVAIARNFRPDHVAILPDKIGAFSIRKGAGLLQLNEASFSEITRDIERALSGMHTDAMKEMPSLYPPYVREVYQDHCVYCFGGRMYDISYSTNKDGEVSLKGKPQEVEIETSYVPVENTEEDKSKEKDIELYLNRQFSNKQRKRLVKSGAAMPDGSFAISNAEDLKSAIKAIGRAKDPSAARRHIMGRAKEMCLTNTLPTGWVSNAIRSTTMTKKELIDSLIKNELTQWEEQDRPALEAFNEDQLTKMVPEKPEFAFSTKAELDAAVQKGLDSAIATNAEDVKKKADEHLKKQADKPKEEPVVNKEMTPEEFIRLMPPEFRAIHNQAMNAFGQEVQRLVQVIVANKNNKFKPEELAAMGTQNIDLLRNMAVLAQNEEQTNNTVTTTVPNFMGLGTPFQVLNASPQSLGADEILTLPVYNVEKFRENAGAKK